jgi:hypothetical protein
VFSGWIIDERGEPLIRHVLRLSRTGSGALPAHLEATAESGRDGSFVLRDIQPGSKLLEVRGPDDGDLPVLERDLQVPTGTRIVFTASEGSLYLTVAPEGMHDVYVMAPRHAAFWVDGLVDFEPAPGESMDPTRRYFSAWRGDAWLQDPAEPLPPWQPFDPARRRRAPELPGLVLTLNSPDLNRGWEGAAFLVSADEPGHTLLVLHHTGFEAAVKTVEGDTNFEHVGTIRMSRVAELLIRVVDADTQQELEEASFEVKETGGSRPDRVTRHLLPYDRVHDCDRRSGRYELRVTAPHRRAWEGSGDLQITADGQLVAVEMEWED